MYNTREEVEHWLVERCIKNYVINEDLTVDVNNSVDLSYRDLKRIPVQFGVVNGNFKCDSNFLINLEGCPREVRGYFDCNYNQLTSLKGGPEIVKGYFDCNNNQLSDLMYSPNEIGGYFDCSNNYLTNLKYCTKNFFGDFDCSNNNLTSLKGCPEILHKKFRCHKNNLIDFKFFPKEVKGSMINFSENKIEVEELVNFNCNINLVNEVVNDFMSRVNKKEFLEKVNYQKIKKENELLKEMINKNSDNKYIKKL